MYKETNKLPIALICTAHSAACWPAARGDDDGLAPLRAAWRLLPPLLRLVMSLPKAVGVGVAAAAEGGVAEDAAAVPRASQGLRAAEVAAAPLARGEGEGSPSTAGRQWVGGG